MHAAFLGYLPLAALMMKQIGITNWIDHMNVERPVGHLHKARVLRTAHMVLNACNILSDAKFKSRIIAQFRILGEIIARDHNTDNVSILRPVSMNNDEYVPLSFVRVCQFHSPSPIKFISLLLITSIQYVEYCSSELKQMYLMLQAHRFDIGRLWTWIDLLTFCILLPNIINATTSKE
jgi:hypothetical protein